MWQTLYWKAHRIRRNTAKYWNILDSFTALPPEKAQAEMTNRLRETVKNFAARGDALPEWREISKIENADEFRAAWGALPILTKTDLQTRFHPSEMEKIGVTGTPSSTGGSTGEPTPFLHDEEMVESCYATSLYARREFGWNPGIPTIIIWGSERDIGKQRSLKNRTTAVLRNEWIVDGYSLNDKTTDSVLELIRRHKKVMIWGFSSLLEFVARQVLERNLQPPKGSVAAAWNGGEMLYDTQRELFEKAFGTTIYNMYGGREVSTMAFQKPGKTSLQIVRPILHVEIVDEHGQSVAPGETGRLIWTSTICRATPFLRYDIGDSGAADEKDRDAAGISALTTMQGRHGGLIKLPNGKTIGGLFWNHFFKDFTEVRQFQVAVFPNNKIELRLVGAGFTPEREQKLRDTLANFLGGTKISVVWVEKLKLTKQGKLLQVVREDD